MRTAIAFAAAMSIPLFLGAPGNAETLKGSELKTKLSGKEIHLWTEANPTGKPALMWTLQADGTIKASASDKADLRFGPSTSPPASTTAPAMKPDLSTADQGRWMVEGDKLCVDFESSFKGDKTCFSVDLAADKDLTLKSDGIGSTAQAMTLRGTMLKK